MSKIALAGAVSGTATFTIESPATSTNRTLTLPDNTGTIITQNSTPAFASTIGVGGATAAASGAGITFPATQSASSNANTLDDYEEGTWTPSIVGSTSQSGQVYNTQDGRYTKIGRQVTVMFNIILSTEGTFSGSFLLLSGLPFTIAAAPQTVNGGSLYFTNMGANYISINLQLSENDTKAYLWGITAAAASRSYVGINDLTNTTQLTGTMTYFV
jgi:hypothetical protein